MPKNLLKPQNASALIMAAAEGNAAEVVKIITQSDRTLTDVLTETANVVDHPNLRLTALEFAEKNEQFEVVKLLIIAQEKPIFNLHPAGQHQIGKISFESFAFTNENQFAFSSGSYSFAVYDIAQKKFCCSLQEQGDTITQSINVLLGNKLIRGFSSCKNQNGKAELIQFNANYSIIELQQPIMPVNLELLSTLKIPNSNHVLLSGWDRGNVCSGIYVADLQNFQRVQNLDITAHPGSRYVSKLKYFKLNEKIASLGEEQGNPSIRIIKLWDFSPQTGLSLYTTIDGKMDTADFGELPNGKIFSIALNSNHIYIWDISQKNATIISPIKKIDTESILKKNGVASEALALKKIVVTAHGYLLTAHANGKLYLWDVDSEICLKELTVFQNESCDHLFLSPNEQFVITAHQEGENTFSLFEAFTLLPNLKLTQTKTGENRKKAEMLFSEGLELLKNKSLSKAVSKFKESLEWNDEDYRIYQTLFNLALELQNLKEAFALLKIMGYLSKKYFDYDLDKMLHQLHVKLFKIIAQHSQQEYYIQILNTLTQYLEKEIIFSAPQLKITHIKQEFNYYIQQKTSKPLALFGLLGFKEIKQMVVLPNTVAEAIEKWRGKNIQGLEEKITMVVNELRHTGTFAKTTLPQFHLHLLKKLNDESIVQFVQEELKPYQKKTKALSDLLATHPEPILTSFKTQLEKNLNSVNAFARLDQIDTVLTSFEFPQSIEKVAPAITKHLTEHLEQLVKNPPQEKLKEKFEQPLRNIAQNIQDMTQAGQATIKQIDMFFKKNQAELFSINKNSIDQIGQGLEMVGFVLQSVGLPKAAQQVISIGQTALQVASVVSSLTSITALAAFAGPLAPYVAAGGAVMGLMGGLLGQKGSSAKEIAELRNHIDRRFDQLERNLTEAITKSIQQLAQYLDHRFNEIEKHLNQIQKTQVQGFNQIMSAFSDMHHFMEVEFSEIKSKLGEIQTTLKEIQNSLAIQKESIDEIRNGVIELYKKDYLCDKNNVLNYNKLNPESPIMDKDTAKKYFNHFYLWIIEDIKNKVLTGDSKYDVISILSRTEINIAYAVNSLCCYANRIDTKITLGPIANYLEWLNALETILYLISNHANLDVSIRKLQLLEIYEVGVEILRFIHQIQSSTTLFNHLCGEYEKSLSAIKNKAEQTDAHDFSLTLFKIEIDKLEINYKLLEIYLILAFPMMPELINLFHEQLWNATDCKNYLEQVYTSFDKQKLMEQFEHIAFAHLKSFQSRLINLTIEVGEIKEPIWHPAISEGLDALNQMTMIYFSDIKKINWTRLSDIAREHLTIPIQAKEEYSVSSYLTFFGASSNVSSLNNNNSIHFNL